MSDYVYSECVLCGADIGADPDHRHTLILDPSPDTVTLRREDAVLIRARVQNAVEDCEYPDCDACKADNDALALIDAALKEPT